MIRVGVLGLAPAIRQGRVLFRLLFGCLVLLSLPGVRLKEILHAMSVFPNVLPGGRYSLLEELPEGALSTSQLFSRD